jgi:hypothetical protein
MLNPQILAQCIKFMTSTALTFMLSKQSIGELFTVVSERFGDQPRIWASEYVHWSNVEHTHSGIRYVSPNQQHAGQDHSPSRQSKALDSKYQSWTSIGAVTLNPEN